MRTSVRAAAAASLLSVVATAAVALAVDAHAQATDEVTAHRPVSPAEPATTPPMLTEITSADIDPTVLAALSGGSTGEGRSLTQVIELTVVGDELELVTDRATVRLDRVPGSSRDWVGCLPPVRVVDARGTGEGWTVRWSVQVASPAAAAHRVWVEPDQPVVVAGSPDGLAAGPAGSSNGPRGRTLFAAHAGYGGGTYEAGGTVTLRLPEPVEADGVIVDLSFSLA